MGSGTKLSRQTLHRAVNVWIDIPLRVPLNDYAASHPHHKIPPFDPILSQFNLIYSLVEISLRHLFPGIRDIVYHVVKIKRECRQNMYRIIYCWVKNRRNERKENERKNRRKKKGRRRGKIRINTVEEERRKDRRICVALEYCAVAYCL